MGEAHEDLHITSEGFDEVGPRSPARWTSATCPTARSRKSWMPIVARRDEVINLIRG
jgi:hypothetical protein